jgi:hypothetical protein
LAYLNARAAAGGLTSANIQSAITSVQNNFGVSDIVNTMPVDALNVPAGATAAQMAYSLALATISQYLNGQPSGTTLSTALQTMQACLAAPITGCGNGTSSVGTLLNTALSTFEAGHSAFSGMTLPLTNFGSTAGNPLIGTWVGSGVTLVFSANSISATGNSCPYIGTYTTSGNTLTINHFNTINSTQCWGGGPTVDTPTYSISGNTLTINPSSGGSVTLIQQ